MMHVLKDSYPLQLKSLYHFMLKGLPELVLNELILKKYEVALPHLQKATRACLHMH